MVDFSKRRGGKNIEKKTNPSEIYDSLDRKSETGPLRPAQNEILSEWFEKRRDEKDVIIKLHTGQGKTLIGLLILQSILNEGKGPALYVCPNKYLVQQTFDQAQKFGIKCCLFDEDGQIPFEFLNNNQILITHVQKVFNGLTKFKLGSLSTKVDTIILDDSHACIDSIKDTLSIKIDKSKELYKQILKLFETDLKLQGEGSYLEIVNQEPSYLPIPHWSWKDKIDQILNLLSKYKEDEEIKFTWPLIKDNIENCQAFISGYSLEINQYIPSIWHFGSFENARQRILMSATTLDDSFFIKGLGISASAIENPLVYKSERWSGEKMILIPSLVDHNLDRTRVINFFAKTRTNKFGIAVIVPSFKKSKLYSELGAVVADSKTIFEEVKKMKEHKTSVPVVFVNRYDGIDLPDDACRLLILDSKPISEQLADKYEESCRKDSDIVNIRVVQKIEQGLGRSVRGEKDYSVILLIGPDIVNFVKGTRTRKLFSQQTQKQIDIGFEVSKMASDEIKYNDDAMKELTTTIQQCLSRDEGWKGFYVEEMSGENFTTSKTNILDILKLERDAEQKYFMKDFEGSVKIMQRIVDLFPQNNSERGWYLQHLARYQYSISKSESVQLQRSAFVNNHALLSPINGIHYDKLKYINEDRISRIREYVIGFADYTQLIMDVDQNCSNVSFSAPSDIFEESIKSIGLMLGFLSQRPDKEYKRGPDNLWCCGNNEYILFECKNEIDENRKEINKTEASQLNSAIAWFEQEYPEGRLLPILIIHTKSLARNGALKKEAKIMRKEKLYNLRKNVRNFYLEFKNYDLHNLTDSNINNFIVQHNLDIKSVKEAYCEEYYHKKI